MKRVLLAFLLAFGMASLAYAAATKFTDVEARDLTVTRTLSVTLGVPLPVVDVAVTSPTVAGVLVRTSAYVVYISTATGAVSNWSKVGGQ
jgi:hypothetical protein